MTPSQRALRAEARAWRECAEWITGEGAYGRREFLCNILAGEDADVCPAHWPREQMRARVVEHVAMHDDAVAESSTLDVLLTGTCDSDDRNDTRVLFCLFMALECESDASRVPPESAR